MLQMIISACGADLDEIACIIVMLLHAFIYGLYKHADKKMVLQ